MGKVSISTCYYDNQTHLMLNDSLSKFRFAISFSIHCFLASWLSFDTPVLFNSSRRILLEGYLFAPSAKAMKDI